MYKILMLGIVAVCCAMSGCSNADVSETDFSSVSPITRSGGTIVWEAQPGTINIPAGQAVTINTDGSVIK